MNSSSPFSQLWSAQVFLILRWHHSLWKRNCEFRWNMRKQGLTSAWVYVLGISRPYRVVSSSSELLTPMLWGLWCFFYGLAQNLNFSSLYSLSASTTARLGAMSQPGLSLMLVVVWDLMTAGTQKYLFPSFFSATAITLFLSTLELHMPNCLLLCSLAFNFVFSLISFSSFLFFWSSPFFSPLLGTGPECPLCF